jgi:tetratricopeptide (TPR) repeat protein
MFTELKTRKTCFRFFIFLSCALFFASCSSVPKRPAELFAVQAMTETMLGSANRASDLGNHAEAISILNEAWRLAVSTDRPALRIRVNLSRGNALYAMGRTTEAEKIWREAELEADFAQEPVLASASRIYRGRSMLLSRKAKADEVLALVQNEQDVIKSDKLLSAMTWTVRGLAEKELARYEDAEKSIRNALLIHDGGRYLEQAAYDWYVIASIRSVAGNYAAAIDALNEAVSFDRRAENTFGLAMDWSAMGNVFRKMGQEDSAAISWRRSAEIFRTMDMTARAREVESRIKTENIRQDTSSKTRPGF